MNSLDLTRLDQLVARVDAWIDELAVHPYLPEPPGDLMTEPVTSELAGELVAGRVAPAVVLPDAQFALQSALDHLGAGAETEQVTETAAAFYLFLTAPSGPAVAQPGVIENDPLAASTQGLGGNADPAALGAVPLENGIPVGQPLATDVPAEDVPADDVPVAEDVPAEDAPE